MTESHTGMVGDPSANAEQSCGRCHSDAVTNFATSLHSSFRGYKTFFETRAGFSLDAHPELEEEFRAECGACHTTCGNCHVSRPRNVDGGLVLSHKFMGTPNQTENCTACHGSRVGEEYTGSRDGYVADVHYSPGGMTCEDCHTGAEMHGDGIEYLYRYQTPDMPRCEDCHEYDSSVDDNYFHQQHWGQMACQVCHSQDYKNCNSCHVGGAGVSEPSYIQFKIGKNTITDLREYEYVALRHIPIDEDTYSPWEVEGLNDYAALPTWKYASPHNIQRLTDRTSVLNDENERVPACSACHDTPDSPEGYFLRQSDLDLMDDAERAANEEYICPDGSPINWP